MKRVRNTLAVLAFTTLFGCAVESPASTPTIEQIDLMLETTHTTHPLTRELTHKFTDTRPEFHIEINTQSYNTLIDQLENGQIDYFMSHYVPVQDNVWAAPMAQDGLILIVNQRNPVDDLSDEQVRGIFNGQLPQWNTINGNAQPIIPLTYPESNDIYHEFHRLVMGRQQITSNAQVVPNISAMIEQVNSIPNAIGYIPFSYHMDSVRSLSINGIMPTRSNLIEHIYPLRTTIFVVGRHEPPPTFRAFFSWVQSLEGQQALGQEYIPLP